MRTLVAWMLTAALAFVLAGCNDQKKEEPVAVAPSQPPPPAAYPGDAGATHATPAPAMEAPVANEPPPPAPEPEPVDTAEPRRPAKARAAAKKPAARQAPKESYAKSSKSAGGRSYTIKKGDTLQEISQKYYGTTKNWRRIYNANKAKIGSNPDKLTAGQKITIP